MDSAVLSSPTWFTTPCSNSALSSTKTVPAVAPRETRSNMSALSVLPNPKPESPIDLERVCGVSSLP